MTASLQIEALAVACLATAGFFAQQNARVKIGASLACMHAIHRLVVAAAVPAHGLLTDPGKQHVLL